MPECIRSAARLLIGVLAVSSAIFSAGAGEDPAELPPDPAPLVAGGRRAVIDGRTAEAEHAYREALDRYRQRDDRIGERTALIELARIFSDQGRVDEAVARLEEALPLADAAADRSAPVVVRVWLAEVHFRAERIGEALAWADAALASTAASEDVGLIGLSGHAYLVISRRIDDGDEGVLAALGYLDERLVAVPEYASIDQLAEAIYALGAQQLASGDPDRAWRAMDDAARIAQVTGDDVVLADYRFGAGYAALQAGDMEAARRAFQGCIAGPRAVAAMTGLGEIDARAGWIAGADRWFEEAQQQATARGAVEDEAYLTARRAALASQRGDLEVARRGYEEAARHYADAGDTLGEVEVRARSAAVLLRLGRWDEARRQAQRSLADNRETFAAPGVSTGYRSVDDALAAVAVLAAVALHVGRDDEAAAERDRLVALARERGRCDALVAARAASGEVSLLAGDADAAAAEFEAALAEGRELGCAVWPLQLGLARVAARLGDDAGVEAALHAAVEEVETAPPPPLLEEPFPLARDRWAPHRALVSRLALAGAVDEALEVHWSAQALRHGIADGGRAMDAVPAGATGLFVASLDGETLLWVVRGDQVTLHRTAVTAVWLQEQAGALVAALGGEPGAAAEETWEAPSRALYQALIEPVAADLAAGEVVAVAGDGPLSGVPWAALRGEDGFFLEHAVMVGMAPGLAPVSAGAARWKARTAIVLLRSPCGELPSTLAAVRKRVRSTTALQGGEVTLDAWLTAPAEADVVVAALPAEWHTQIPGRARIGFAGQGLDGDWLELGQLSPSPWAARVVVWACPAPPAMARPLRASGAGPVLLPLWPPGDEATAALLGEVLKKAERHGIAAALQRVQRARIKDGVHPREWAGWVVY